MRQSVSQMALQSILLKHIMQTSFVVLAALHGGASVSREDCLHHTSSVTVLQTKCFPIVTF